MTHFAIRSLFLSGIALALIGHLDNPSALFGERAGPLMREAGLRCSSQRAACQIAGFELGGDGASVTAALIANASKARAGDMLKDLQAPEVLALLDERVVPDQLVDVAQAQLGHWAAMTTDKLMTSRSARAERALN